MSPSPRWTPTLALSDIPEGGAKIFKGEGKQIAIFRLEEDHIYAIDNRCPHEGYPLAQGHVKGCLLTCAWHNFKFDLRDGECVMGDEAVRTFPHRFQGDVIELDLADPDPALAIPGLLESLREGLFKWSMGRVTRDAARLLQAGFPPEQLIAEAATYDCLHGEYGPSHALPVSRDILRYLPTRPGLKALQALFHPLDLAGRGSIRRGPRPLPEAIDPGADVLKTQVELRALVEAEEGARAQALLRGALQRGWGREELEPFFFRISADHFLDIGHALIYTVKAFDLLDAIGWEHGEAILMGHLHGIVCGTREDTLPKWAGWQGRRMALREELPALYKQVGDRGFEAKEGAEFLEILIDGKGPQAFLALVDALKGGISLKAIAQALVIAASHRVLRFDGAIQADPTLQHSWLDITHTLTFADALTDAVERYQNPGVIELLLQAVPFINGSQAMDLPPTERFDITPLSASEPLSLDDLMAAIDGQNTQRALTLASTWHNRGQAIAPLRDALEERAIRDPATRPIYVAHHIKTTLAALDQYEALAGKEGQEMPLLALIRFVSSPAKERSVSQVVHEAVAFIEEGKTPRVLT